MLFKPKNSRFLAEKNENFLPQFKKISVHAQTQINTIQNNTHTTNFIQKTPTPQKTLKNFLFGNRSILKIRHSPFRSPVFCCQNTTTRGLFEAIICIGKCNSTLNIEMFLEKIVSFDIP